MLLGRATFLAFAVVVAVGAAGAQPTEEPADSTKDRRAFETSFKFYPSPIWSRTAGFSAGVGFEMENFIMPGGRFLATVKPGQHLGRYTATYFAKDAFSDAVYGLANVYYETTGHQWFYGIGPGSKPDSKIAIEKDMLEAEVRLGVQPLGRRVQLQSLVKYIRHGSENFKNWDEGAIARLDERSLKNLESFVVDDVQKGMSYGLMGGIDLRDKPVRPRRGLMVQGTVERFDFSEPSGLTYDQYGLYAYAFLPLRSGTLGVRGVTRLTNNRGIVEIPFYLLHSLHGRILPGYSWDRFFGPDLLAVTLEYKLPLFNIFDWAALDWLLSFGAGNVYDDLFDQFEADITFKDRLEPGQDGYPMRPSMSTGFDLYTFERHGFDVRVLLGWGTEGIRLVKFGFVHDLREVELSKR